MAITLSTGIFTGLDTGKIISQLMSIERRPLEQLNQKKSEIQKNISTFGSLSGALSSLKSSLSSLKKGGVSLVSATSSDTTVFSVMVSSSASEGDYNIKVNSVALAQSLYSQSFDSENEAVADLSLYESQTMRIQVGGNEALDITIDSSNNSLAGIRDAINNANAGIKASIINDGNGYRLILTSNLTGDNNRITIKVDEDNNGIFEESGEIDSSGLSRLAFNPLYDENGNVSGGIANLTQSQAARNASLTINGLTITRQSNTINDLITGVTINLLKDSSGNTIQLRVKKDTSSITNGLNAFVSSYNNVLNQIKNTFDKGIITDATMKSIVEDLRMTMTTIFADKTPASFGLMHDREGNLTINQSLFNSAMENDGQKVVDSLHEMATNLEQKINAYVNNIIPTRKTGAEDAIKLLESRISNIERRLEKREFEYQKSFIALEKMVSELQRNGNYLDQQFSLLSKIRGGK